MDVIRQRDVLLQQIAVSIVIFSCHMLFTLLRLWFRYCFVVLLNEEIIGSLHPIFEVCTHIRLTALCPALPGEPVPES